MKTENRLDKIEPALDRFREAHYWIHQLEDVYHYADRFRWCLNAYIKSIKEVPLLLGMGLQNAARFSVWYKPHLKQLMNNPLQHLLNTRRNFIVHRGMFIPNSHGEIGVTEGRGVKLGIQFKIDPLEDSDSAMDRFLHMVAKRPDLDLMGVLTPDEDSVPCIHRVWKVPEFEEDLLELASQAWLRTGETINEVVRWLGCETAALSLSCRRPKQKVNFKYYDRCQLNKQVIAIRKNKKM